jgi:uncharacterized membrane protein (UPF0136 family)
MTIVKPDHVGLLSRLFDGAGKFMAGQEGRQSNGSGLAFAEIVAAVYSSGAFEPKFTKVRAMRGATLTALLLWRTQSVLHVF